MQSPSQPHFASDHPAMVHRADLVAILDRLVRCGPVEAGKRLIGLGVPEVIGGPLPGE